jgi:hypothetical protein
VVGQVVLCDRFVALRSIRGAPPDAIIGQAASGAALLEADGPGSQLQTNRLPGTTPNIRMND